MPSNMIVLTTVAIGVTSGALIDLWTRRVPNELTVALTLTGFATAVSGVSDLTFLASLAGFALGLGLMLPPFIIGGTGAGDVKLFAAIGALIGPMPIAIAFLYTAMAGGVFALVVAIRRQRLRKTIGDAARIVTGDAQAALEIKSPSSNNRFAYAPAIAVGTVLATLGL